MSGTLEQLGGVPMLTVAAYADLRNLSVRQVQRYRADGRLPGAQQDARGAWFIPADVVPTPAAGELVTTSPTSPTSSPLGELGTLEDAAAVLGTTTGGVRRMARDGLLVVGPYGPRGALRVYVAPR